MHTRRTINQVTTVQQYHAEFYEELSGRVYLYLSYLSGLFCSLILGARSGCSCACWLASTCKYGKSKLVF